MVIRFCSTILFCCECGSFAAVFRFVAGRAKIDALVQLGIDFIFSAGYDCKA